MPGWTLTAIPVVALVVSLGLWAASVRRAAFLWVQAAYYGGALVSGAALFVPVSFAERYFRQFADVDPLRGEGGTVILLLNGLFIEAPLEMGAVTLAAWPFWRGRRRTVKAGLGRAFEIREGVLFAASAGLGFALARSGHHLIRQSTAIPGYALVQVGIWSLCFLLLTAGWGYVLGRYARYGMGSRRFQSVWAVTVVVSAVCDQLIFRLGRGALVALAPLFLSMLLVALVVWRDYGRRYATSSGRLSGLVVSAPAPSLDAIREAFERKNQSVTIRWIVYGAVVTTGMITTGIVISVWLGHEFGLDFSAVDRVDAGADAMAPLAVLGSGALAAFPGSGYLLARASRTTSVLEPALAATMAMVLVMFFLGILAPISLVFAIAFAPVGFLLTCVGAWFGLVEVR
ncbi:MAG: hypothetical protein AAGA56_28025 [Myxococcota bacterium]